VICTQDGDSSVHMMNERFILFPIVIITQICGYILVKMLSFVLCVQT